MQYLRDYPWSDNIFAIIHGKEFILDCILFTSINSSISHEWIIKLNDIIQYYKRSTYTFKLEKYLQREYNIYQEGFNNS